MQLDCLLRRISTQQLCDCGQSFYLLDRDYSRLESIFWSFQTACTLLFSLMKNLTCSCMIVLLWMCGDGLKYALWNAFVVAVAPFLPSHTNTQSSERWSNKPHHVDDMSIRSVVCFIADIIYVFKAWVTFTYTRKGHRNSHSHRVSNISSEGRQKRRLLNDHLLWLSTW